MRDYIELEPVFHPYLGFTSPPNVRAPTVSTDSAGFRRSEFRGQVVCSDTLRADEPFGVVLGNSFTFGVGASHDRRCVVSRLGEESGKPFINRSVRAGNSLQELLGALPVLGHAEDVVVCSGVNNLSLGYWSARSYEDLGPFFYDESMASLAGRRLDQLTGNFSDLSARARLRAAVQIARGTERARPSRPPRLDDANEITSAAARRHIRDLKLVAAAARADARVMFVMQPFNAPATASGNAHGEEGAPAPGGGDWWAMTIDFVAGQWPAYTELLRQGCAEIGVSFGALAAAQFAPSGFVDTVHMTDEGQGQAAPKIIELMVSR